MYRLWLKKGNTNDHGPLFDFPFVSIPQTFKLRQEFKDNVRSPFYTEEWFPSFVQMMHSIVKKSKVSMPIVMVALLYVGRLRNSVTLRKDINPLVQSVQIFLISLIIAQKVHSDIRYTNREWAQISGYALEEINRLERYYLYFYLRLNAKFAVSPQQYQQWHGICHSLQAEYEFTFRSYTLDNVDLVPYLMKARRHRPELVEEILKHRGLSMDILPPLYDKVERKVPV
ncbi:hypothetical protein HDU91_003252 [Kappamyces sp. JEL0680]|nr:hypothetical protein HDU91_003252 [Kappamyces sp. JEL0680]